jgi:potassium-dependent mechanosensitive channel
MLRHLALRRFAIVLILFVAAALPGLAAAQSGGRIDGGIIGEQQEILNGLRAEIDEIEKRLPANADDDIKLVEFRLQLEDIDRKLLNSALAFRPRLNEINQRLTQLGPVPGEGEPTEPDIVTLERQGLLAEKAEINALIGTAETQSLRIGTMVDRIAEMRRDLFARLLTKRYEINSALFEEVAEAFVDETDKLWRTVSSWLRFAVQYKLPSMLAATFFALLAAAVLLIGGRRLFGRLLTADPEDTEPPYLSRLSVAFWSTLLPTAALAVFFGASYFFYDYFSVLRGDIGEMLVSFFYVTCIVFLVYRLARLVFSPGLPAWRLVPVRDAAARPLVRLIAATAVFTGLDYLLSDIYEVMGSPLSLTVAESLVSTVITGILVILIGLVKPFADAEGRPRRWHPLIRFLLFFLGASTTIAALLGYIGLARFVSQQIVVTGAILATMYLGFQSAKAISEEGAFKRTGVGRRMDRWFSLDDSTHDQFALVLAITINFLVLLIGLPLILLQWGFQLGDLITWIYRLASEIRIGSFAFSLGGVLTGIVVFVVGYFVTRWFQSWLDGSVMARGRVDAGLRNSIRIAVGYVGIALAILVAVSAAGIDLSNFALVAGALSLGIGFGLQNIVSNFVSGLILLAERPFKVGDWIVAGQVSGLVRRIRVRATEIETFQRQVMILPNSELINAAVGNWTLRNKLGRVDIKVQVAYGEDARKAYEIMLEIARAHPMVLKNPEPFVYFANFGPAAMEFEVRVFVADILNGVVVQNDIRFAVLDAFAREGVEIPAAPRHVAKPERPDWPGDDEKAEAELLQREEKATGEERPRARRRPHRPDPDSDEAL